MAGVNFNSLAGIGDKLTLGGLISNGADLKNARIAYSVPLMSNGLVGELSYSQTNYSLVEEYEDLDAIGISKTFEGRLRYPIMRTWAENLYANLSLFSKDLKDEVSATSDMTKKDLKSLRVELDYNKNYITFGKNVYSSIIVEFYFKQDGCFKYFLCLYFYIQRLYVNADPNSRHM